MHWKPDGLANKRRYVGDLSELGLVGIDVPLRAYEYMIEVPTGKA
jgi:hypothetical protein